MPQATSDLMTAPDAPAAAPIDWKRHHARHLDELEAEGMRITDAEVGAWWFTLADIRRTEDCDAYGAEAHARRAGVMPPPTHGAAWARLRDGDFYNPGTRAVVHSAPDVAPISPPRVDPFLDAWMAAHDGDEVRPEDISPSVYRLFVARPQQRQGWTGAPAKRSPFPDDGPLPHDIAMKLARTIQTHFNNCGDEHGRLLEVKRGAAGMPVSFCLRHPPLPAPPPPADPTLLPAHAALVARMAAITADPEFFALDTPAARAVHACNIAWPMVCADLAREHSTSPQEMNARLRAPVFKDPAMQAKARAIADAAPPADERSVAWAMAVDAVIEAEAERTADDPRAVRARMLVPGMSPTLEGRQ
jgi:hypothetical protein